MNISFNRYLFAHQVSPTFKNSAHVAAPDPIGIEVNGKTLDGKVGKLKSLLEDVDLHHITPNQLGLLGVKLYEAGEISDISVGSFVVSNGDLNSRDKAFDAIEYFENTMKLVKSDSSFASSIPIYGDTLNTFYNLDIVIRRSKGEVIDTFA